MAYNKRNKLLQQKMVLEIYLREKKDGVSTAHIHREHINKIYPMSRSTLYNILSTPVEKLLKEEENKRASQLSLL